jgi:methyltransferase (TIGR00027 family)
MVARSRYAEDQLAHAVRQGVNQYVILGAGLDTFAYRNPYPAGQLRVFEVDHPATQAWKRDRLTSEGIAIPSTLAFAPVDFERDTLATGLRDVGFQADQPTFFSWLGVTPYLSPEAFDATLSFIAGMPRSSGLALDYAVSRDSLNLIERTALDALASRVASAGEPFQLFFGQAHLASQLRSLGFCEIEDIGSKQINDRYFSGRSDGLQVIGGLARLLSAYR